MNVEENMDEYFTDLAHHAVVLFFRLCYVLNRKSTHQQFLRCPEMRTNLQLPLRAL